jgi:hypothetical protein
MEQYKVSADCGISWNAENRDSDADGDDEK